MQAKRCRRKDASLAAVGKMLPAVASLDATGKMSSEGAYQKGALLDAVEKMSSLQMQPIGCSVRCCRMSS